MTAHATASNLLFRTPGKSGSIPAFMMDAGHFSTLRANGDGTGSKSRNLTVSGSTPLSCTSANKERFLMKGWQPIDTAPRDGTPLLLWPYEIDGDTITGVVGCWGGKSWTDCVEGAFTLYPTHWMRIRPPDG